LPEGIKPDVFMQELGRIGRDVWSRQGTANSTRVGDLGLIADDSAKANLETAAPAEGQEPVWFFYIHPGDDTTVDGNYASAKYAKYTSEVMDGKAYQFVNIYAPGLPHASENRHAKAYNEIVSQALRQVEAAHQAYTQDHPAETNILAENTDDAQSTSPPPN
jgi:hypothetical protein